MISVLLFDDEALAIPFHTYPKVLGKKLSEVEKGKMKEMVDDLVESKEKNKER